MCISDRSPTAGLRFQGLRQRAITELAGSQASDRTIMSIVGRVSEPMSALYSQVRIEAKRRALDALTAGTESEGYVAKNVTKQVEGAILNLQVLERNGGDDGTRTRGLCRDSLWFRGNCVKIHGADRQFWRPE
jgi:hypothetical protein